MTVELDGVRLPTVSQWVAVGGTDDEVDVEFAGQRAMTTPLTAGTYELTTSGTVDDRQFSTAWILDVGQHPDGERVDADGYLKAVPVPGGRCDPAVLGS